METIAMHKTFEQDIDSKRQVTLFISDGADVQKVNESGIQDWIDSLPSGTILRVTAVHACDALLTDLVNRGHSIVYANWHALGLDKNLSPEQIVIAFANSTAEFRKFQPRPDLSELRYRISQRLAILEYRKAVVLKLKGAGRLYGQTNEDNLSEDVKALLDEALETDIRVPTLGKNGKEKLVSIDTVIANIAKKTRECVLFNATAHIEGAWNTAATVVAFSGGIDRFDTVAAFWHYCGEHVVDGKAPKRAKGKPVTWSPKLRTCLWQMSDSLIKNRNNPWRSVYEQYLAEELAQHETKHPKCKTTQGHCGAMARRKVRKDILKRFFLAVKGVEYSESSGHQSFETPSRYAAA